jgi:phage-related minor tail protein
MSDKEAVLELMRDLPAEASLREILQGIEKMAASRQTTSNNQVIALRSSSMAASVLSLALAEHHGSTH